MSLKLKIINNEIELVSNCSENLPKIKWGVHNRNTK